MKPRDRYLEKLIAYKDKPFIKVITGVRRCGKSTLLALFREYLLTHQKISHDNILTMNFESHDYHAIDNHEKLYAHIASHSATGRMYVLLDEVQVVSQWEKAVNALAIDMDCDIYITGSNAFLLSSELSTLLSGRYVEIQMFPLSFKEYLLFIEEDPLRDTKRQFTNYLAYGGLPAVTSLGSDRQLIQPFLSGILDTVLMKDIVMHNNIRDVPLLESIIRYLAEVSGNPVSVKKISDYLTSAGRKISSTTVDAYIGYLQKAFIIYKAERYDIKGKQYLSSLGKYYLVDVGLRNALLGYRNADYGRILENVVFLELLQRGYDVSVGKINSLEVDFIATKPDSKIYIQVSASILDENTRERELRPLQQIDDNYEKIVLTMDESFITDYQGIRTTNIIDFLLQ